MEIVVDLGKCQGYGNCVLSGPEIFDLDDNGKVVVLDPSGFDAATARIAVRSCPAHALELAE
ncbi:ferredoxin [Streptomyces sp. NPDC101455]|uniref:ferredoxin n=1 Tax=Streptomyces sp. NPDC101455 TaxID=3366142 RepID=UPI0037F6C63F